MGEKLVRSDQVAALVPPAAGRPGSGDEPQSQLRRSRLLGALAGRLRQHARDLGFDLCRVAKPDALAGAEERLTGWLAEGHHATMDWMARDPARRADPRRLWPDVRSIIMVGVNYAGPGDALAGLAHRSAGNISVYARTSDYHDVIKGRLKQLAAFLCAEAKSLAPMDVKVFVDTAAVMEKPLAQAAGLGWQGKHTNLVSREFGSWLFLGALFTTLELPAEAPEVDHCGSCRACLDICPTAAFPAPYRLDAGRCIAYLTIEHKGPIPVALRPALGNRIYGCDDCLAVCPWNKFAQATRDSKLKARQDLEALPLEMLARLDDRAFRRLFAQTPVKRIGRDRFVRNVLVAIGNSGDQRMQDVVIERIDDASPLVRGAAVWAAGRLLEPARLVWIGAERAVHETVQSVGAEWRLVLGGPP